MKKGTIEMDREKKFKALFENQITEKRIWFYINVGDAPKPDWGVRVTEWLQYIGLRDKNDKEIYEKDVVHYVYKLGEGYWNQDCIGIIKWDATGFKMEPPPGKGGLCTWLISIPGAHEPSCRKLFEIIGNIYEGETK